MRCSNLQYAASQSQQYGHVISSKLHTTSGGLLDRLIGSDNVTKQAVCSLFAFVLAPCCLNERALRRSARVCLRVACTSSTRTRRKCCNRTSPSAVLARLLPGHLRDGADDAVAVGSCLACRLYVDRLKTLLSSENAHVKAEACRAVWNLGFQCDPAREVLLGKGVLPLLIANLKVLRFVRVRVRVHVYLPARACTPSLLACMWSGTALCRLCRA